MESRKLSDAELAMYNALDPSAATSTKPWEFEAHSKALRRYGIIAAVVVLAVHIFMSVVVGIGYDSGAITLIDRLSFGIVGFILAVIIIIALGRPRVRVNADGVEVRNFLGTRFYYWQVIYGLSFPRGSRIARLELPEFEYVPMWALQAADKATILSDVTSFRSLEARYMPED